MQEEKQSYYDKISLKHKSPEEAERIHQLFQDNIKIAYKIALKYYKTDYWDRDEALQIAQMGLWKACLIWDPEKYRLSTLAYNIINRDFIDFDKKQKRQPDILFNIEENCVTDDLSLLDILIDNDSDAGTAFQSDEEVKELTQDIIWILDDIAQETNLPAFIIKLVYLVYVESPDIVSVNMKALNFLPKTTIKQIISELQRKLSELRS